MQDRVKVQQTASRMDTLREQNFLTDVTLVCDGGAEIPAHRFVLSSACAYFQAKFACPIRDDKFEMKGIREKPLKAVVRYMYSGSYPTELEKDVSALKSTLVTADFLQLPSLVSFCRESLVKNMSLDNCLQLLDVGVASPRGDEMTKYAAENFHKLYYTTAYLSLTTEQITTLLKSAKEHQTEDTLMKGIVDWVKFDLDGRAPNLIKLTQLIDIDRLTYECLQLLSDDILLKTSVDFARLLFKSAIESMDIYKRIKILPKEESLPSLKLDFLVNEVKLNVYTCTCYTYFFDDQLWSEGTVLGRINEKKVVPLCKSGNYIYYFERSGKNLVSFAKVHSQVAHQEELEYPFERLDIYSTIEKDGFIFAHVGNRLVRFKPRENEWQVICTNLPTTNSVLVSCSQFIFCVVWDAPNLIRIHPDSRSKVFCSLPENYKLSGQKISSCMDKLYFYEDRKKYLVVYDCRNNDWQSSPLPNGVRQLGDKWEFCSLRKETPCLIFIDEFKLVWKYAPDTDTWKRISSEPKYVTGLMEIIHSD